MTLLPGMPEEVADGLSHEDRIVTKKTQSPVTSLAEDSANAARLVVVVNRHLHDPTLAEHGLYAPAYSAYVALPPK